MSNKKIVAVDYVVFSLIFLISLLIGFFHWLKPKLIKNRVSSDPAHKEEESESAGKETDEGYALGEIKGASDAEATSGEDETEVRVVDGAEETADKARTIQYLTASKSMGMAPLTLSLLATIFSSTPLLGLPAEIYQFGIEHWISTISIMLTPLVGAYLTGPIFARINLISVFEYLELRFGSKVVRLMGTAFYSLKTFTHCGLYILGPSACVVTMTDLSNNLSLVLVGVIATIYTMVGGIRSVIWNDAFQAIITFVGIFTVMIKGIYNVGGLGQVWKLNYDSGRINFFNFDPDPFLRQSFWSLIIGMGLFSSINYGVDQAAIQRFTAARSVKEAQKVFLINVPFIFLLYTSCCFMGLVMFANYYNCDPLLASSITGLKSPNQLMPYFIMDKMNLPGIPGIFIASILSSSMSSVSSAINSISVILYKDVFYHFQAIRRLSDSQTLLFSKLLIVFIGLFSTFIAFLLSQYGSNLSQLTVSLIGALNGPVCGLFVLGCFIPLSNKYGAMVGSVFGFAIGIWLSLGAFIRKPTLITLPTSAECYANASANVTEAIAAAIRRRFKTPRDSSIPHDLYSLSYLWVPWIEVLSVIAVAMLVSLASRYWRQTPAPNAEYLFQIRKKK